MDKEEAIDILKNCIADYVIGDFCVGKFCPMEKECKDKECVFEQAIDIVSNYIEELEKEKNNTMPIKLVLDMLEDLDKRRDIQKDTEPITGYWSKRAMLKKLLKQAGFDYSKYKKENVI